MNEPEGRPDHLDAVRALFFGLLAYGGVGLLSRAAPAIPHPAIGFLIQTAFFASPLLYARGAKLRPFEASGYARLRLGPLALVVLASLGTMWLLQGVAVLEEPVLRWLGWGEAVRLEKEQLRQGLEDAQHKGLAFETLLFVIASPLGEETLFRGIALRGLARRMGAPLSIGITSLFFAAMHATRVQLALMFVLGAYFGTLVWLTRSLWAGILAHAANNLVVVVLTEKYGPKLDVLRAPWWMYALSGIVFAGAMTLLALDRRKEGMKSP